MREIKFRAWCKEQKWMVDSSYGDWISFDGIPYTQSDKTYNTPNTEIEQAKEYILMQFIGLHDKNGKEIYEGDVVNSPMGNVEVLWCNIDGLPGFYAHRHGEHWVIAPLDKVEVIGNIYESPELEA